MPTKTSSRGAAWPLPRTTGHMTLIAAAYVPLVLREFQYRLLQGKQQGRLAEMAIGDGRLRRVATAITWIREHFTESLQVEDLARLVSVSPWQNSRAEYRRSHRPVSRSSANTPCGPSSSLEAAEAH